MGVKGEFIYYQTTYKELKPTTTIDRWVNDGNYQTTYKELKQAKYPKVKSKSGDYQTTYKELKLYWDRIVA